MFNPLNGLLSSMSSICSTKGGLLDDNHPTHACMHGCLTSHTCVMSRSRSLNGGDDDYDVDLWYLETMNMADSMKSLLLKKNKIF